MFSSTSGEKLKQEQQQQSSADGSGGEDTQKPSTIITSPTPVLPVAATATTPPITGNDSESGRIFDDIDMQPSYNTLFNVGGGSGSSSKTNNQNPIGVIGNGHHKSYNLLGETTIVVNDMDDNHDTSVDTVPTDSVRPSILLNQYLSQGGQVENETFFSNIVNHNYNLGGGGGGSVNNMNINNINDTDSHNMNSVDSLAPRPTFEVRISGINSNIGNDPIERKLREIFPDIEFDFKGAPGDGDSMRYGIVLVYSEIDQIRVDNLLKSILVLQVEPGPRGKIYLGEHERVEYLKKIQQHKAHTNYNKAQQQQQQQQQGNVQPQQHDQYAKQQNMNNNNDINNDPYGDNGFKFYASKDATILEIRECMAYYLKIQPNKINEYLIVKKIQSDWSNPAGNCNCYVLCFEEKFKTNYLPKLLGFRNANTILLISDHPTKKFIQFKPKVIDPNENQSSLSYGISSNNANVNAINNNMNNNNNNNKDFNAPEINMLIMFWDIENCPLNQGDIVTSIMEGIYHVAKEKFPSMKSINELRKIIYVNCVNDFKSTESGFTPTEKQLCDLREIYHAKFPQNQLNNNFSQQNRYNTPTHQTSASIKLKNEIQCMMKNPNIENNKDKTLFILMSSENSFLSCVKMLNSQGFRKTMIIYNQGTTPTNISQLCRNAIDWACARYGEQKTYVDLQDVHQKLYIDEIVAKQATIALNVSHRMIKTTKKKPGGTKVRICCQTVEQLNSLRHYVVEALKNMRTIRLDIDPSQFDLEKLRSFCQDRERIAKDNLYVYHEHQSNQIVVIGNLMNPIMKGIVHRNNSAPNRPYDWIEFRQIYDGGASFTISSLGNLIEKGKTPIPRTMSVEERQEQNVRGNTASMFVGGGRNDYPSPQMMSTTTHNYGLPFGRIGDGLANGPFVTPPPIMTTTDTKENRGSGSSNSRRLENRSRCSEGSSPLSHSSNLNNESPLPVEFAQSLNIAGDDNCNFPFTDSQYTNLFDESGRDQAGNPQLNPTLNYNNTFQVGGSSYSGNRSRVESSTAAPVGSTAFTSSSPSFCPGQTYGGRVTTTVVKNNNAEQQSFFGNLQHPGGDFERRQY